jgi:hypothetical protein
MYNEMVFIKKNKLKIKPTDVNSIEILNVILWHLLDTQALRYVSNPKLLLDSNSYVTL